MKSLMQVLCVLLFVLLMPLSGKTQESPSLKSENPENIRKLRHFRSDRNPSRLLEYPKYILEIPWYPIKHFLNFSEKTDLFNRFIDVFYFNEEKTFGWFPNIASLGLRFDGGGVSIFHRNLFERKQQFNFSILFDEHDQLLIATSYAIPHAKSNPYFFNLKAGFERNGDVEIYTRADPLGNPVLGFRTTQEDRKSYFIRRFHAKFIAGRKISRTLDLTSHLRAFQAETKPGLLGFGSIPATLPGFNEDIGMVGGGIGVRWDTRDNELRPFRGNLVGAEFGVLMSPQPTADGDRFGFTHYSLDARQYIPVFFPNRVLALHQTLHRVDPLKNRQVPFIELPILDLMNSLRSFNRNRFRDRGAFSLNVEYRYPIWVTWDAYFFFDAGQEFENYADLSLPDFQYSGGFGIRFMTKENLLMVIQIGAGNEGATSDISTRLVF
jgi:outer membrane protein assembly factor BamA